ncbi:peptidoglycan-binding protein [Streptomyces sp. NBC_01235]|uniref:peptidoglycan-binding protein n=1 Tax=Streptomyces sp. NBC_01235 TaxID=2903788 RepID=UPI002E0E76D1|nr:peptidoglycan-binding protein [Streptomyces sp. NBC_01235]
MEAPVFEEFDPASDCECPGCVSRRRVSRHSPPAPFGGHPAAHRALVVATAAAAAALGAGHALPAVAAPQAPDRPGVPAGDEPETPQGGTAPLHGPAGQPARPGGLAGPVKTPATTRADIIRRAKEWVSAEVPYSMGTYWYDGYRQDCSGFVSMAWNLPGNEWTGSLHQYGTRISKGELQPGDILLFHNPSDPENGSHVVIFGGWTDYTHSYYIAYEQTRPAARRQATPYAYWSHSGHYVPYRYKGLTTPAPGTGGGTGTGTGTGEQVGNADGGGNEPGAGDVAATPFPGRAAFGPGANNKYVTLLGRLLVERGGARFYTSGPGPRWSAADGWATQAFQRAQGWSGAGADGIPGPKTWSLLVTGKGKNIEAASQLPGTGTGSGADAGTGVGSGTGANPATGAAGPPVSSPFPSSPGGGPHIPPFPGRGMFRPGAQNAYVTQLGRQLVKKGFGRFYASGPGPRWGEADRRGVEAFQRAQGWRGGAADGYPGPETWRRLFS